MHTANQVCIYLPNTYSLYYNYRELLGKDQSHNGLSLANKFVMALISDNLYSPKTKGQRGQLNK